MLRRDNDTSAANNDPLPCAPDAEPQHVSVQQLDISPLLDHSPIQRRAVRAFEIHDVQFHLAFRPGCCRPGAEPPLHDCVLPAAARVVHWNVDDFALAADQPACATAEVGDAVLFEDGRGRSWAGGLETVEFGFGCWGRETRFGGFVVFEDDGLRGRVEVRRCAGGGGGRVDDAGVGEGGEDAGWCEVGELFPWCGSVAGVARGGGGEGGVLGG